MPIFTLNPGQLTLNQLQSLDYRNTTIVLAQNCIAQIQQSRETVSQIIQAGKTVYGINTGFGLLANKLIQPEELSQLQKNIIVSHAAGTGELLDDEIVALILLLKINSLARGFSGVRLELIEALIALYNHQIYPCIPAKGSVGASGDLAPLAHLSAVLLGYGKARHQNQCIPATEALAIAGLKPLTLAPKEGLALINGTQVSTALAVTYCMAINKIFETALIAGAMTTDAAQGSIIPFEPRIHAVRGHSTQSFVAKKLYTLLQDSLILAAHKTCQKVQDPYSLRCQPQVMGACLNQIHSAAAVLETEMNAVSDNPLVFSDSGDIISGGNFHAEPVAMAADNLALAIAEIGALSERRISLLIDKNLSGLPAFLVQNAGLDSGFMIAHVTATALASENKSLAHPACVDSLPTSANQEDHVSMATFAARRLKSMVENTKCIVAIELLAAAQGIDFHAPLKTSATLLKIHQQIRDAIPFYKEDRYFADDIEKIISLIPKLIDVDYDFQFTHMQESFI